MNKSPRLLATLVAVVFTASWALPALAVPPSLLTNAGAETGDLTGWTANSADEPWTVISGVSHGGTYSFVGGNGVDTLTQTVDLLGLGYTQAQLDSLTSLTASVWVKGYDDAGESDTYDMGLSMLGSGGGAMALTSLIDPHVAPGTWTQRSTGLGNYGPGMRYARVTAVSADGTGAPGHHGTMFDDFVLSITDDSAPTVSSVSPADDAINVSFTPSLTLNFSEAVTADVGNIVIHRASDDATVATIDVTSGAVTGSGTTAIAVALPTSLLPNTTYYVAIDAGAFVDAWSNPYAGLSTSTVWNFRTRARGSSGSSSVEPVRDASISDVHAAYRANTNDVSLDWHVGADVPAVRVLASSDGTNWAPISDYLSTRSSYIWSVPTVYAGKSVSFLVEATDLATRLSSAQSPVVLLGVEAIAAESKAVVPPPSYRFVRSAQSPTVYAVDADDTRHPVLDVQTFFTWQKSFSTVEVVSAGELAAIPLGRPLLPQAGRVLVKIQSSPNVYAIEQGADGSSILRGLPDEAAAEHLYGRNWADYIIDLPPTVFGEFSVGASLSSSDSVDISGMVRRADLHE